MKKENNRFRKRPWCWGKLKPGGEGDDRGWDGWMASPTQWTWVWANSGRWWRTRKAWRAAVHGVTKSRTWLSDWTTKHFSISLRQAWWGSNPEVRCGGSFILETLTCLNILNPHYPRTVQGHWRQEDETSWPFDFSKVSLFYFFSIHLKTSQLLKTSQPFWQERLTFSVSEPHALPAHRSRAVPWPSTVVCGSSRRCPETCSKDPTPAHVWKPDPFRLVIIAAPRATALQVPSPPPLHGPHSKSKHRPIPFLLELLHSPRWCLGD